MSHLHRKPGHSCTDSEAVSLRRKGSDGPSAVSTEPFSKRVVGLPVRSCTVPALHATQFTPRDNTPHCGSLPGDPATVQEVRNHA